MEPSPSCALPCPEPCQATVPSIWLLSPVTDLTLNDIWGTPAAIPESGKKDEILIGVGSKWE